MLQSWLDDVENTKISSRNWESNPGPSIPQPTRSQLLNTVEVQESVQSTAQH